jgi:hypothetical protein
MTNLEKCNVCGEPFVLDRDGEWVNHGHKLPPQRSRT